MSEVGDNRLEPEVKTHTDQDGASPGAATSPCSGASGSNVEG